MSRFDAVVGLDLLSPPDLLETLSETEIVARLTAAFVAAFPQYEDTTEYDPVKAPIHVAAYQELMLRQRINNAAAAATLATASGSDLEVHGYKFGVTRKVITPADPDAVPPIEAVMESDDDYRRRIQLAPEGLSVAGPAGSYVFWARGVEGVRDAAAWSPSPAEVVIAVMSTADNGESDQALLDAVAAEVDPKRPVADRVTYQAAAPVDFSFEVTLTLREGPASEVVLAEANASLLAYLEGRYRIGESLHLSGLYKAVTVEGVEKAVIISPAAGLEIGQGEFARLVGTPIFNLA